MGEKTMVEGSLAKKQPRVIVIEADKELRPKKLRVAAYARVSSDSTDQLNSFMTQVRYYTTYITSREEWTFVDLYADEGITGTSAGKRTEFQRLIADCKRGLIDKVLCKSISRFARITTDCLENIRLLKGLGVGVCFEEQNIDTAQMSGELLTAVFAAISQKESESISTKTSTAMGRTKKEIHTSSPKKRRWSDGSTKASCRDRASGKSRAGWMRRESSPERARNGPSPPLRIS